MSNNKKPLTRREHKAVQTMAKQDARNGKSKPPVTVVDDIVAIFNEKKHKENKAIYNTYRNAQDKAEQRRKENERIQELKKKNK